MRLNPKMTLGIRLNVCRSGPNRVLRSALPLWTADSRFSVDKFCSYATLPHRTLLPAPSMIGCQLQQRRHLLPSLPNPFGSKGKGAKLEYSECHLLGYSMAQMYDIVSRVEAYHEFVPWCKQSVVMARRLHSFDCKLTVGFPPLVERYTSLVTVARPHLVKSECFDGKLFKELLTIWRFGPGMDDRPDTCTLKFFVSFEFRSALHSQLAQVFFDEVVRTMVGAFLTRAHTLHGPQTIRPQRMKGSDFNPTRS